MYCQLLMQTQTQFLQNIEKIQNKALTVTTIQNSWQQSEQIYKEYKIFKLRDSVTISNLELAYEQMKKILPRSFRSFFVNKTSQSLYNTRGNTFEVSQEKSATYGSNLCNLCMGFLPEQSQMTTLLPDLTPTNFLKIIKTCISENV